MPSDMAQVLRKAVNPYTLRNGFAWILEHLTVASDTLELTSSFLERYEQQVLQSGKHALDGYRMVFRAALLLECLKVLQSSRMRFAIRGFNPVFMRTWLQKNLLATLIGISLHDVELKIRLSGRKPPNYLADQINSLLPKTCLTNWI